MTNEDGAGRDRHHWTPNCRRGRKPRSGYSPRASPDLDRHGLYRRGSSRHRRHLRHGLRYDHRNLHRTWGDRPLGLHGGAPAHPHTSQGLVPGLRGSADPRELPRRASTGNSFESDAATGPATPTSVGAGRLQGTSGNATDVRVSVTLPNGTVKSSQLLQQSGPRLDRSRCLGDRHHDVHRPRCGGQERRRDRRRLSVASRCPRWLQARGRGERESGDRRSLAGPVGRHRHRVGAGPFARQVRFRRASIPGKTASYSLAMANRGSAPAASLTLADTLPAGTVISDERRPGFARHPCHGHREGPPMRCPRPKHRAIVTGHRRPCAGPMPMATDTARSARRPRARSPAERPPSS